MYQFLIDNQMILLISCASLFAFIAGYNFWKVADYTFRNSAQRSALFGKLSSTEDKKHTSLNDLVIDYAKKFSQALKIKKAKSIAPKSYVSHIDKKLEKLRRLAGFGDKISAEGFAETQFRFCITFAVLGFVVGLVFSTPLALAMCLVGAYFGFNLPLKVARKTSIERARQAEQHLPEMLDVLALGMRSGMSLDSSLYVYSKHFNTSLSQDLANAQKQWSSGLSLRDESLRNVAASYDSVILGRVMETIIRSVRYGSSMVDSLERDAAEARNVYQARCKERIAKAPVKMMVPTGVLILPAMMIMVLGPVLLELIGGGF